MANSHPHLAVEGVSSIHRLLLSRVTIRTLQSHGCHVYVPLILNDTYVRQQEVQRGKAPYTHFNTLDAITSPQ